MASVTLAVPGEVAIDAVEALNARARLLEEDAEVAHSARERSEAKQYARRAAKLRELADGLERQASEVVG